MVPTYNERENVETLHAQILALGLDLDLLFVDDNSPDGTGAILDRLASTDPRLRVTHRDAKEGVGSAHLAGIRDAYARGYRILVTMDADLTHSPGLIPVFLARADEAALIVGSRFLDRESLADWSRARRSLTWLGHLLTRRLLGVPYDATGALRLYRLDRIPADAFDAVQARSYDFFFESMYVLWKRGVPILELPIALPKRTYGHSKMRTRDIVGSVTKLVTLWARHRTAAAGGPEPAPALVEHLHPETSKSWDEYWRDSAADRSLFAIIAKQYRRFLISPAVRHFFRRYFRDEPGRTYLHAGCGSAESDRRIGYTRASLVLLDISPEALKIARRNATNANVHLVCGDIFNPPFRDAAFDGIWNLGVMEHFHTPEIERIFAALGRILKPGARCLIFWPPKYGLSVLALTSFLRIANAVRRTPLQLYPDEVSLFSSTGWARGLLHAAGLAVERTHFGIRDLFTYVVLVASKDR
jgi:dolichol-phosphate mannosyltransferase